MYHVQEHVTTIWKDRGNPTVRDPSRSTGRACVETGRPRSDQSQPPVFCFGRGLTGLRWKRMHRNVRVLHQPGPLRDGIKQDEGVSQCAVHLKPLPNVDEVSITRVSGGPQGHTQESPMSKVFVLDTTTQPLDPVHPGRARLLLKEGKAAIYRRYPFTLILKTQVDSPAVSALRLKLDPGAKTSGLALVDDASGEVVWAAELGHRGASIKKRIDARRGVRRKRRSRFTRYRKPRFHNRRSSRRKGRLPPSLESRVANMLTWVGRLRRLCPIEAISMELVKFDMQAMQNPEIT